MTSTETLMCPRFRVMPQGRSEHFGSMHLITIGCYEIHSGSFNHIRGANNRNHVPHIAVWAVARSGCQLTVCHVQLCFPGAKLSAGAVVVANLIDWWGYGRVGCG